MMGKLKGALLRGRKSQGNLREDKPRPSSPLDFQCGGVDWMDTDPFAHRPGLGLEALDLGPITDRSLRPMAPLVVTPQEVMAAAGPSRKHSIADSVLAVLEASPRRDSLGDNALGLLTSPLPQLQTPTEERGNPFDESPFGQEAFEFHVTPLPRRERDRKAASVRGRREMPLRVQAIRRSHQQAFAEALAQRLQADMEEQRRATTVELTPSRIVNSRPRARSAWQHSGGQPYISLSWPELSQNQPNSLFSDSYSLAASPAHRTPSPVEVDPLGDNEGEIPILLPVRYGTPF